MKSRFIRFAFGGLFILAAIGLAVMLLWNWLMPPIFGLITINYLQAIGLIILSRIFFGGFGGRRAGFFGHRENPIHKRWRQMTPEQQKEFVEKRRRFGMHRHFFDNTTYGESENEK